MELHAVKVQTGRYMSTWELRIRKSGKVVGELIHNPSKSTYTALAKHVFRIKHILDTFGCGQKVACKILGNLGDLLARIGSGFGRNQCVRMINGAR